MKSANWKYYAAGTSVYRRTADGRTHELIGGVYKDEPGNYVVMTAGGDIIADVSSRAAGMAKLRLHLDAGGVQ